MLGLAKRLKQDTKTGKIFIKDFKPPVVDLEENKKKILPMVSKLQQAEKQQTILAKKYILSHKDPKNQQENTVKTSTVGESIASLNRFRSVRNYHKL